MLPLSLLILFGMFDASASDYHSAKTAALAGAGHALPTLSDQIYLNPAATSFTKTYNVHFGWESYHGPDDREPRGRTYGVALLDGRNDIFQAGVGFQNRRDGKLIHIGASKAYLESLGIGVGTKYGWDSAGREKLKDGTASVVYEVMPDSAVSIIVDNLLASDTTKSWGMEREYILGLKYAFENIVSVYIDPHLVPALAGSGFGYEAGVELQLFSDVYARIGKSKQSFQPHLSRYGRGYGWGFGWLAPKIEIDFAVQRTLEPVMTTNTLFSATVLY